MALRSKRDLLEFDRSDRIGLRLTLWTVVAGYFVTGVASPVRSWLTGSELAVDLLSKVSIAELDRVGTGYGPAHVSLVVASPQTLDYVLALLPGLLDTALAVAFALVLQRVMSAIASGEAFEPRQVGRLRWLAAILIFGSCVHLFLTMATSGAILGRQSLGDLSPGMALSIPWLPFMMGLVLAMLAEAFTTGRRLRDDVEGLI